MKCSNCGSNIPANAKFCGVCGTPTQPAEAESALETVAFDPSSDPEFKAAAEKLEAENKKQNESKVANQSEPSKTEEKVEEAAPVEKKSEQPKQTESKAKAAGDSDDDSAAKKKGKFRETIWFMQADDPEMMSSIENEDLDEREATYQDPGGNLDERSREKFSLNISESSMMKAVERENLNLDGEPENSKSWFYASIVIGAVSLGYVLYLVFTK